MSTVNISLPAKQVGLIDRFVDAYGFANRSEFIRSLIRLITHKPQLIEKAAAFPFVIPQKRSVKKIMADFTKTGKYSNQFLKDLKEGLTSSKYFNPQV